MRGPDQSIVFWTTLLLTLGGTSKQAVQNYQEAHCLYCRQGRQVVYEGSSWSSCVVSQGGEIEETSFSFREEHTILCKSRIDNQPRLVQLGDIMDDTLNALHNVGKRRQYTHPPQRLGPQSLSWDCGWGVVLRVMLELMYRCPNHGEIIEIEKEYLIDGIIVDRFPLSSGPSHGFSRL
jgi:hypothetical protein